MSENVTSETAERLPEKTAAEMNSSNIEEEILSDGSRVWNVHIKPQVVYCRTQIAAINLITDINIAIQNAI